MTYGYGGKYSNPASDDVRNGSPDNDGLVEWTDILSPSLLTDAPDWLAPGSSITVVMTFTAEADTSDLNTGTIFEDQTIDTATVGATTADPDENGSLPAQAPLGSESDQAGVQIIITTGLILGDFGVALVGENAAEVTWVTESETDMLGFHVVRRLKGGEGDFDRVSALIPAAYSGQDQGETYKWLDENLNAGTYQYRLEIVWLTGASEEDGLDEVTIAKASWEVFLPFVGKNHR